MVGKSARMLSASAPPVVSATVVDSYSYDSTNWSEVEKKLRAMTSAQNLVDHYFKEKAARALFAGKVVISDRFFDASTATSGGTYTFGAGEQFYTDSPHTDVVSMGAFLGLATLLI